MPNVSPPGALSPIKGGGVNSKVEIFPAAKSRGPKHRTRIVDLGWVNTRACNFFG